MEGTDNWSVAAGIVLTIAGAGLLVASLFFLPLLFYAIPALVIGIVILATLKKQEYIEPIRKQRTKKSK